MRYSHQRQLVKEIIKGRKDHPTADAIYLTAREKEPSISLGTVYRNLKQLGEDRELITLETMDKKIHYDGDVTRHRHFICNSCGKIIDFFIEVPLPKEVSESGVTVNDEKCIYYGTCKECSQKTIYKTKGESEK